MIIGGGVIGTSIAFHLAEAGVSDVLLLERDALASGSTARAAGGVRTQFSDELNIRIALRSIEAFMGFDARPGGEIDLHQVGYLFALTTPEQVAAFEQSIELQNALGVPSRLLSPDQVGELNPLIRLDDVLAGAFCSLDGHATPEAVVQGYANAARAHGATLVTGCSVEDIEIQDGEVRAVATSRGRVETGTVVCAAGAWSRAVGEMAGFELDVTPLRRQVLVTEPVADLPDVLPMTIDFANGFYFHREGRGLLMGVNFEEQPGFKLDYDDGWLPELFDAIEHRAPALGAIGVQSTWAGLYEVSPDHNAMIGEASGDLPLPLRHGLLGPRLPAGSRGGRDRAGHDPRARAVRGRLGTLGRPLLARGCTARAQHHLIGLAGTIGRTWPLPPYFQASPPDPGSRTARPLPTSTPPTSPTSSDRPFASTARPSRAQSMPRARRSPRGPPSRRRCAPTCSTGQRPRSSPARTRSASCSPARRARHGPRRSARWRAPVRSCASRPARPCATRAS